MRDKMPAEFSLDQFQFILDQLPLRVFWKDRDSRYLGCNAAFAQDAGLSCPADIIGKSDFDLPWSANAAVLCAHDQEVIARELPFQADEEPLNDLHGLRFWMHKNKMPLRNQQGNVIGVLGMYDDISPLKTIQTEDQKIKRAFNLLIRTNHAVARAQMRHLCFLMCVAWPLMRDTRWPGLGWPTRIRKNWFTLFLKKGWSVIT